MYPSYSPLFTLGLLAAPVDAAPSLYLTLKTGKRDGAFLYLDLADGKPHPPSQRRPSKSTSWTCTADYDLPRPEKPMITSPTPVVPARRRTSKESLRNIPSPKPAPSATLPDLPTVSDSHLPPVPPLSVKKRPASIVASTPLSPTVRVSRPASLRSESICSHDRRKSRMDALACLEGRSRAPNRVPRSSALRNNFMSFSDDEDEQSMVRRSKSPSTPATSVTEDLSAFADVEDEADSISSSPRKQEATPARPAKPGRKRRGTIDSWFPLKSFIDFKDDDLSWNWRSFVEIGGVA